MCLCFGFTQLFVQCLSENQFMFRFLLEEDKVAMIPAWQILYYSFLLLFGPLPECPVFTQKQSTCVEVSDTTGIEVSYGMPHIQSGAHMQSSCVEGHLHPDDNRLPLLTHHVIIYADQRIKYPYKIYFMSSNSFCNLFILGYHLDHLEHAQGLW